ncbi:hypothetical protein F7734_42705 [Scytonema sp. UIC 10036]|uniref:Calx-beta domain-containing protein n=1 Tax=Scytonema sp. UIC 10036 TaxID=2304196 RepID=UPI0012DA5588|nr:Ig-like domain repeat protein [Scytonema sp. UIC 10036]MUG98646.1 hypothetical protein [Scytonema sp. UIC 10036]
MDNQLILNESFTGSDVNQYSWIYGNGGGLALDPFLTARSQTTPSAQGGLPGGGTDAPDNGALRLTNNSANQASFVIYNQPINSASGLSINFDLYSYGGSGADGISFFLIDGSANPTKAGAPGGSLGYSNSPTGTAGIVGGYIGIGFDEFGNFSASGYGNGGVGQIKDSVVIRGSEKTGYQYLTGKQLPSGNSIDNTNTSQRSDSKQKVQIDITPGGLVSVQMDLNQNGTFETNEKLIDNFNVTTSNNSLPQTFKFGFSASTGGSTNVHEINNFKTNTFTGSYIPLVNFTTTNATVNENGSLTVNAQLDLATSSEVTVPLTLSGAATNGIDYNIPASITFGANQTTASVTLTPTNDTLFTANKTVNIAMGTPTHAQLSPQNNVFTATIVDDDLPSFSNVSGINYIRNAPAVAIAPSLTVGNVDPNATLTGAKVAIKDGFPSEDVLSIAGQSGTSGTIANTSIQWSYSNGVLTLTGTGSVEQYQSALRQVAYSNPTSANTTPRTVGYSLQAGGPQWVDGNGSTTITYVPFVKFTTTNANVAENNNLAIEAQLDVATSSEVTVPLTLSGAATNGIDYNIPASITFGANQTTASVTLTPTNDTLFTANKTVNIAMGTPTHAQLSPQNNVFTATIVDDDLPSFSNVSGINYIRNAPAVAIAPSLTVGNVDPNATLTGAKVAIKDGFPSEDVLSIAGQSGTSGTIANTSIQWSYSNGVLTLTGTGSVEQYQSALRQVAYSNPTSANTTPRTVGYSLQAGGPQWVDGNGSTTITYVPFVKFTTTNANVAENNNLAIEAQLDVATSSEVTVPLTLSGAATNGIDYNIPASITFGANQTTASVTLTPTNDTLFTANKTVNIAMGTPTHAQLSPQNNVFTATIVDDDLPSFNVSGNITYTRNDAPTAIAPQLSIGNADSNAIVAGGKVAIKDGFSSSEDVLSILGQSSSGLIAGTNITWNYDNNAGILTLTGDDSVTNYQSVLSKVAYNDTSTTPNTAQRTLEYSLQIGNSTQPINGSSNATVNVRAARPTTTTSTTSVTLAVPGQSVILTGNVSIGTQESGTPTGSITFMNGDIILGTVNLEPNATSASLTTNALGVGTHNIKAVYSGDSNFATSNSDIKTTVKWGSFNFDSQLHLWVNQGKDLTNLLFNNNYYLANNSDVAAAVANGQFTSGLQHFLQYGKFEGRDPSVIFSNSLYLSQNSDVAAVVAKGQMRSGFEHFINYGFNEHRDLRMLSFDEGYYLAQNQDVFAAVKTNAFNSGFEHYLLHGQKEGRNPTANFDEAYYLDNNLDAKSAVTQGIFKSGFDHFVSFGMFENRNPVSDFNSGEYLSANSDIVESVAQGNLKSGVQHAVRYGQYEARTFFPQLFDEHDYLTEYSDVAGAVAQGLFKSGLDHFIQHGQKEGRRPSKIYNEQFYLTRYSDVADAVTQGFFKTGFEHFILYGRAEGRFGIN